MQTLSRQVVASDAPVPQRVRASLNLAFVGWASSAFVVGSLALLIVSRHVTGGRVVYVLDDAAIHLSIARTLLHHGTWGVHPGVYQSASSSPVWDVLVAAAMWLTRLTDILPWALNVVGGLWLIWAIGSRQRVLRPSRRDPMSVIATAGLVAVVLFMPALTMVGMEHLLHAAMVVQLVAWVHDRATGRSTLVASWAPCALAAVAVLTRFETAWVVAGLGLAYLIDARIRAIDRPPGSRHRLVIGLALAIAAPLAGYAILNRAMGQGLLPNSVIAKTFASNSARLRITPQLIVDQLTADPVLAVLLIGLIAYLAVAIPRRDGSVVVPAVTFVVALVAHSTFAQYGYFERYQTYLVALGIYAALAVADESLPDRSATTAVMVIALLLVTPVKWSLLILTPRGADNTYAQRYQAALFVQRYYGAESIATGELGYLSLFHRGPVTDLLGLGDYEVLQHRRHGTDTPAFYADLARRRGVQIVVVYSGTLGSRTPTSWLLVADWRLHGTPVSTLSEPYQFWATSPSSAVLLRTNLLQNAARLPAHVSQVLNPCLDAELGAPRPPVACRA